MAWNRRKPDRRSFNKIGNKRGIRHLLKCSGKIRESGEMEIEAAVEEIQGGEAGEVIYIYILARSKGLSSILTNRSKRRPTHDRRGCDAGLRGKARPQPTQPLSLLVIFYDSELLFYLKYIFQKCNSYNLDP